MPHALGRKPFKIKAKAGGDEADVLIYGDIGESWHGESVEATAFVKELADLDVSVITARINSYGGSVTDGLAIFNALRRHKATVHTYNDGISASIASLIFMGGDVRHAAENARFMIHAPWGGVVGNAEHLRDAADELDGWAESMASAYVTDELTYDDVLAVLKDGKDHWYSAAEAEALGIVDNVTEALDIAAKYAQNRYTRPAKPKAATVAATHQQEPTMPQENTPATASDPQPSTVDNVVDIKAAAERETLAKLKARNERLTTIRKTATNTAVRDAIDDIIRDPSINEDAAFARIEKALADHDAEPLNQVPTVQTGMDEGEKAVEGMTNALLARVGAADHDRANPWRGMRLHEVARSCLERGGVSVRGQTPEEFASLALSRVQAAQTTSDFPVVLENTLHKMVLRGHEAITPTYTRVAKLGDVSDFREWNRLTPGMIGNLDGVDEHGAYRDKALPDAEKQPISASRKGNIISVTPEVLVNDDLSYITDLARQLGMAGNITIDRAFYTLLESNPTMSDGTALFHADHGNLAASGAVPSVTTLDAAAVAMSAQTAPGDDAVELDITPDIALASRTLRGTLIEVINAEFNDEATKYQRKPNRVRGIVSDIVTSSRMTSTTAWYLFADPMISPVIEVVFLNGQRAPRLTMEENFRTAGLSWRVEMPFGVGAIGYRGGYKNDGA
jgi:ATP-dependent protease ClpP protease subunit